MTKYRIKEINGHFYPQERIFLFLWDNIKLYDRVSRDWFNRTIENNRYNGTVEYHKDAWGVTLWLTPEFDTLDHAKSFIEEYKKYLERKYQNAKAKYHY